MGTYAHTNVGNATARTMYASAGQVQDSTLTYLTSVAGTNAITASAPIVMTAYAAGQTFQFIASASNTGATTININSIGLKSITRDGTTALVAGDIVSGGAYQLIYDGTQFQLTNSSNASVQVTSFSAGTTGLTPSTATTGAITLGGTLGVANGGTGTTTAFTAGSVVFAGASGTYTQDNAQLFWDNTNDRLGIGTASPIAKLQVRAQADGNIAVQSSSFVAGGVKLNVFNDAGSANTALDISAQSIQFATAGTERMRLDSSGNLGLGVTPNTWSAGYNNIQFGSVSSLGTYNSANITQLRNNAYESSGWKYIAAAKATMYQQDTGAHSWYTAGTGTVNGALTWTTAMTLDASGNLQVGRTSNFGFGTGTITLNNASNVAYELGVNGTGVGYLYANSSKVVLGAQTAIPLTFETNAAERMRIDASGNLLVGTTSSFSARLSVKDSTSNGTTFPIYCKNSSDTILFYISSNGYFVTGTGANSPYNLTTASGSNVTIESDGVLKRSTSSLKYKTDVQDATHGLAEVLQLRPVTYKGKNDGDTVFGGLIAEEVHEAGLTEFVQYADDETPDALAYGQMVSLAFKAIQEQQAMIDELKAKVAALEAA
jgi:hypothetical protein